PRGHSRAKVLLRTPAASKSLSIAHATIRLPLGCLTSPNSSVRPVGGSLPVSSRNSRRAAAYGSSPSSYSPLTIDHPPSSLFAQNGPPMCAMKTSSRASLRRKRSIPALRFLLPAITAKVLRRRRSVPRGARRDGGGHDSLAHARVAAHKRPFLLVERTWVVEDAVGGRELAGVVQLRGLARGHDFRRSEAELVADALDQIADVAHVVAKLAASLGERV